MKSEEFIKACKDGKTLVWGQNGVRMLKRSSNEKKLYYLDVETGFSIVFDRAERCGESAAFIMIGENPVGVILTKDWEVLPKKEVEE